MEIWHIGHSCFKIKGKGITLITDPFDPEMVGLKFPQIEADIVTISHNHEDHNRAGLIEGSPVVIFGPGEYEVKGVKIIGIQSFHDNKNGEERGKNTVFQINIDGISLVHLGDLGQKLATEKIEKIQDPDVLFLPVGGNYTIDPKQAVEVLAQFEPAIVIPMHYLDEKAKNSGIEGLLPVSQFLKILGKEKLNPLPKLTISKEKIPQEREIIVLT